MIRAGLRARSFAASLRASLPIDVGLLVFIGALVIIVVLGRSHLRPFDAPELDPRPILLPLYLVRSLARLAVAYFFAVTLALAVGRLAARSPCARRIILPTLDVLQSVPILGFFPAAVAVFIGIFRGSALGVEAAADLPHLHVDVLEPRLQRVRDAHHAARGARRWPAKQFGLRGPLVWTRLILPAVAPNLLYNSILSWSNGWYFLMASEIIAAGPARYTLPGLGSYLAQAIESRAQRPDGAGPARPRRRGGGDAPAGVEPARDLGRAVPHGRDGRPPARAAHGPHPRPQPARAVAGPRRDGADRAVGVPGLGPRCWTCPRPVSTALAVLLAAPASPPASSSPGWKAAQFAFAAAARSPGPADPVGAPAELPARQRRRRPGRRAVDPAGLRDLPARPRPPDRACRSCRSSAASPPPPSSP